MKVLKSIAILFVFILTTNCNAQSMEHKAIKKVITEFSKAGDSNNISALENTLDDNYRVVMNRLFGSNEVSIISKSVYLEKIKTKEWGGDTRKLTIENIIVNESNAAAKVTFKGAKATFISLIDLVKNDKGAWKLISDLPIVK